MIAREQDGYVALMSVLIMGAGATAITVSLLLTGIDSQRSASTVQAAAQARKLNEACLDEALLRLHDNTSYSDSGVLNLGQGTCNYTVSNSGGSSSQIISSGSVNGVVIKSQTYVTINTSNISVTSSQHVP